MMTATTIREIRARQVYDSRGNPTVEVDVILASGARGRGTVPSGASTGKFEAVELRDRDATKLGGRSVLKAVNNVVEILAPAVIGMNANDLAGIDHRMIELDGTPNKSRLGANAILGVSMAAAWAAANASGVPLYRYLGGANAMQLPVPMVQIIGGGLHANSAVDIQDYLVIPVGATGFAQAIEMAVNVYNGTKAVLDGMGKPTAVADEGGFWPFFSSNVEGVELLLRGIEKAGYRPGEDIALALDVAASHFHRDGRYTFSVENKRMDREELCDVLASWVDKYPLLSIEDAMAEDDWEGWRIVSQRLKHRVQLIGDDVFVTNVERIRKGVDLDVANAVLIKPNQVGTITETLQAIEQTKSAGYLPVISARSGETEDMTIVHLAVATNAGQLKVGSVARTERMVKWNEGIRIEEAMGEATYAGRRIFQRYSPHAASVMRAAPAG
jgi:enolase